MKKYWIYSKLPLISLIWIPLKISASVEKPFLSYEQLILKDKQDVIERYYETHNESLTQLVYQVILCCVDPTLDPLKETKKLGPKYFYTNILVPILQNEALFNKESPRVGNAKKNIDMPVRRRPRRPDRPSGRQPWHGGCV